MVHNILVDTVVHNQHILLPGPMKMHFREFKLPSPNRYFSDVNKSSNAITGWRWLLSFKSTWKEAWLYKDSCATSKVRLKETYPATHLTPICCICFLVRSSSTPANMYEVRSSSNKDV